MTSTLSLGLVAIPVRLHATRRREGKVSYHLVHATCGSRVKRQYVCEKEDIPVEDAELTRAYESEEGEEVVMSKEEVQAVIPKTTGRIDLIEFVPTPTIDPVYFDNAYYLSAGKGGDHAYHLLAETLRELDMVGVGTQLARGKSYLVALRATELGMVLHTLHHEEEVHAEANVDHGDKGRLSTAERELARSLVTQLQKPAFDVTKFEDEADEALRRAIAAHVPARKAEGDSETKVKRPARTADLLEALRASLMGGKKKPTRQAARAARAAGKGNARKSVKAVRKTVAHKRKRA